MDMSNLKLCDATRQTQSEIWYGWLPTKETEDRTPLMLMYLFQHCKK